MYLELSQPVDCLCDFTYDFYWQHGGKRLSPSGIIPHQQGTSYTYSDLVECLKRGEDVRIKGSAGKRLGSSLGVNLKFFGGTGEPMKVGSITVDGDVDTRMGISMVSGAIYVKGAVKQPLGNVIEVESDLPDYRKYRSITGMLHENSTERPVPPNTLVANGLVIKDHILRDTIAARLDVDKSIAVDGDAGMSAGILMRRGTLCVYGNAGMNAGVLQEGGILVVGDAEEFAGAYMRGGTLVIAGKAKGYVGANTRGGAIFLKGKALGTAVPPTGEDIRMLIGLLDISRGEAMMFRRYGSSSPCILP